MESANSPIVVDGFEWDYSDDGNVPHLLRHEITTRDVEAVLAWGPVFRKAANPHSATFAMIGRHPQPLAADLDSPYGNLRHLEGGHRLAQP